MKSNGPNDRDQAERDKRLKKIAERIKTLRKSKGSMDEFAYENGISRSQVWRVENGQEITLSTLLKVIDGLGMRLSDFFDKELD